MRLPYYYITTMAEIAALQAGTSPNYSQDDWHYIDLSTFGSGAGAGFAALVVYHRPSIPNALAPWLALPHLLDPSSITVDNSPGVGAPWLQGKKPSAILADLGVTSTMTMYAAAVAIATHGSPMFDCR